MLSGSGGKFFRTLKCRLNDSLPSFFFQSSEGKPIVALGPKKSTPKAVDSKELVFTCIVCQEEEELVAEGPALVMAAFVQRSIVLSRSRTNPVQTAGSGGVGCPVPTEEILERCPAYESSPILLADLACAPYTSSCGHVMHASCWKKYFDDTYAQEKQRSRMRHPHSFDVDRSEYLCPLCRYVKVT